MSHGSALIGPSLQFVGQCVHHEGEQIFLCVFAPLLKLAFALLCSVSGNMASARGAVFRSLPCSPDLSR